MGQTNHGHDPFPKPCTTSWHPRAAVMRVLLVAHSCSPSGGSEARMTWQWATYLAMNGIDVTALVNRADPTSAIDPRTAPIPEQIRPGYAPEFINVEPPVVSRRLPVVVYTAMDYQGWQRRALGAARALHQDEPFDLVHHLSWASIHHGSWLNRLDAPFVLGPVGGGTTASPGYKSCFPDQLALRTTSEHFGADGQIQSIQPTPGAVGINDTCVQPGDRDRATTARRTTRHVDAGRRR